MTHFDDSLIDKIYEASFITDRWPNVLNELCLTSETEKAALFAIDGHGVGGWVGNDAIQNAMRVFIDEGWMGRSVQTQRAMARRETSFFSDHDLFTDEEMETSEQYNHFLKPNGLRWGAGAVIRSPSKDTMIFTLHRSAEKGPLDKSSVSKLTDLRPHLARSALASARLRLEQAKAAVQALHAIGLPAWPAAGFSDTRLS